MKSIEWLVDNETGPENPIWHEEGCFRIKQVIQESNVNVWSVCADYLQFFPLSVLDIEERHCRATQLSSVIRMAHQIGAKCVLVPCADEKIRADSSQQIAWTEGLTPVLDQASQAGIRVGLEMNGPARDQSRWVKEIGHPSLGIYYDLGNATHFGHYPPEDIQIIGDLLVGVHIKDRNVGGASVILGQGDTDFINSFRALEEVEYKGPLVLETPRGVNPIVTAREHLAFVRRIMGTIAGQRGVQKDVFPGRTQAL